MVGAFICISMFLVVNVQLLVLSICFVGILQWAAGKFINWNLVP